MVQLKVDERIDALPGLDIRIIQSSRVFSFSLDAVLLAYFTRMRRRASSRTVDLCSGNGAVGLFVSQKTRGKIIEIELQPKLADMARRSVRLNHKTNQIRVLTLDLKRTFRALPKNSCDVVTCNPPYFANLKTSHKNPNPYLAIARHEIKTNLRQVVNVVSQLLKSHGHADLVYRPDRLLEMLYALRQNQLVPKRLQFAYPTLHSPAQLVLIDAVKSGKVRGLKIMPPLIIRNQDNSDNSALMKKIMQNRWPGCLF